MGSDDDNMRADDKMTLQHFIQATQIEDQPEEPYEEPDQKAQG